MGEMREKKEKIERLGKLLWIYTLCAEDENDNGRFEAGDWCTMMMYEKGPVCLVRNWKG